MMTVGPLNKLNFLVLSSIFFLVWRNILTTVTPLIILNIKSSNFWFDLIFLLLLKMFQNENYNLAKEMNYKIFIFLKNLVFVALLFWIQLFRNVNFTIASFPYNWKKNSCVTDFFVFTGGFPRLKCFFWGLIGLAAL